MSETNSHFGSGPFAEKPQTVVSAETPARVMENSGGEARVASSVASTVLHERGGRVLINKGDVYTNPKTGERIVVEGVRGKGDDQEIAFTQEIKEGVRAHRENPIQRKQRGNFEVQKEVGGYSEPRFAYEQEFDDIFNDCQQIFGDMTEILQGESQSGAEFSREAQAQAKYVGLLSLEVGSLDDAWNVAELLTDKETAAKKKMELLADLKLIVTKLPEAWVKPYPRLQKIQTEQKGDKAKKKSDAQDAEEVSKGKRKTQGKKLGRPKDSEHDGISRRGRRGRVDQPTRTVDSTQSDVPETADRKYTTRQIRVVPEAIDPEFFRGVVEERFVKYGLSQKEWSEDWTNDDKHTLVDWIAAIRVAQQDLTALVDGVRQVRRIRRWGQAMDSLDEGYRSFAQSENGDVVIARLAEIEAGLSRLTEGSSEWQAYAANYRPELREILFRYLDILRAGVYIMAQARKQNLPESALELEKNRSDARQDEQRKQKRGRPSLKRASDKPFEAAQDGSPEKIKEGGVETEEGNAELFRWIGGIRQQLQDLDQLAGRIFRRKLTQEFKNALFAVSTDHEALARTKRVREVSGELDDIESSLSPKHRWSSQEEYDEWFSAKVMRLQNYARLYDEILRTGERVLSVKSRKALVEKGDGYRQVDGEGIVEMTSTERALKTVGTTYEGLEPEVQQALLQGVERIAAVTRATVERADAALLDNGITNPDERRERIAATFAPKVGEAVKGIMSHAGFRPAEIERLTRTLLIAGPRDQDNGGSQLGYDRQN